MRLADAKRLVFNGQEALRATLSGQVVWTPKDDPAGTSAWWRHPDADPYGLDTMRESSDGTGDPVELNDSVGWAEDVS